MPSIYWYSISVHGLLLCVLVIKKIVVSPRAKIIIFCSPLWISLWGNLFLLPSPYFCDLMFYTEITTRNYGLCSPIKIMLKTNLYWCTRTLEPRVYFQNQESSENTHKNLALNNKIEDEPWKNTGTASHYCKRNKNKGKRKNIFR